MAITRQQKAEILDVLKERFDRHEAVVFISYRGTSVKDITTLRKALRAEGLDYQVAKKRLVQLAAKETSKVEINDELFNKMPFGVVFGYEDQIMPCKLSAKFAKEFESIEILGGIVEGKVLDKDGIMQYAALPTRDELLAKFVGLLRAPLGNFRGALDSGLSNFVRTLSEYSKSDKCST